MMMKLFHVAVLGLIVGLLAEPSVRAETRDAAAPLLTVNEAELARNQAALSDVVQETLPSKRLWHSHSDLEYKQTEIGHKIFTAFDEVIHPMLEKVLTNHPQGEKLQQLRRLKNVDISHYMVPMRDGVHLSTIVINPLPYENRKSTMLSRSPYGPTSDHIADIFIVLNGMAAVIQDQRGTFKSEGEFSMWHEDANDGYDTIAWIAKQPWSNGKVYSIGISADGCGTAAMILSVPPQLKGQVIMWATMEGHETVFPGGVFREGLIKGWMTVMSSMTKGGSLKSTLPQILAHEKLSDWWAPIQGPGHYHQAAWPTIHISAWWDIFSGHHIRMFNGIASESTLEHFLFVGPLGHCVLGNSDAPLSVQEFKGISNALALAGEVFGELPPALSRTRKKVKRINVFMQSSRKSGSKGLGNYWSSMDQWPTPKTIHLMLGSDGTLELYDPNGISGNGNLRGNTNRMGAKFKEGFAEFAYNPLTPLVTKGGNNFILMFMGFGCGSTDQQVAERRPDVVVFTTPEPLLEPLALLGQMKAVLYVSTNKEDTDFYVSVTDVHPDGASMQIRYGIRRMKWRESTETESIQSATVKNKVYRVEIDLWFTGYIVADGHRLRVMISSSNTPYYAKSDNSGDSMLGSKSYSAATNRIYWSEEYPSRIEIPMVSLQDVPRNDNF